MDDKSLEGWAPEIPDAGTLAEVVDRAFDYRGDVTVVLDDGRELIGYLFNRNRDVAEPFLIRDRIDLHNDAVRPVIERVALLFPLADERQDLFQG